MPAPQISPLPTPPSRSQSPETFSADADAFLGALPEFQTDANAQATYLDALAIGVDADAVTASNAAAVAAGAANYRGDYSAGTTYQIGQSVSYNGRRYVAKTVNTGVTPADGANWFLINDGDVLGPISATNNGIALYDGTTGKILKSSLNNGTAGQALLSGGNGNAPTWGNVEGGVLPFTASGSIAAGQPVCLRSDGAVEVATGFQQTETLGAAQNSANGTSAKQKLVVAIPNTSNLLVVTDNGTTAQVVVASVSGSTITYGTPVTAPWNALFLSNETLSCVHDAVSGNFLITYAASSVLYGVVCTVSGTTVSFGTQQSLVTGLPSTQRVASCYDSLRQQCIIGLAYIPSNRNFDIWRATISGTVITVAGQFNVSTGSGFNFEGVNLLYDSIVNRIVFVGGMTVINNIQLISNSGSAFANVGGAVALGIAPVEGGVAYDSANNKYVAVNADASNNPAIRSFSITASTITVDAAPTAPILSGTTVANATGINGPKVSYDSITQRMVYLYYANSNTVHYNTSSGFGSAMTFSSYGTPIASRNPRLTYLPQQNRTVILVIKDGSPNVGINLYSFLPFASTTNTQNFIGLATSSVTTGQTVGVTIAGGRNTSQTALITGANYFLNSVGALVTTGGVRVGEALSATSILVEGKLAGAGTPNASTFLRGDGTWAQSGSMVLLSSATVSGTAAFIEFTGLSGYNAYVIDMMGFVTNGTSSSDTMYMQFYTNGVLRTAGYTTTNLTQNSSGTVAVLNTPNSGNSEIGALYPIGNFPRSNFSSRCLIVSSDPTLVINFDARSVSGQGANNSALCGEFRGQFVNTEQQLFSGIRIYPGSQLFSRGTAKIYGIL